MQQRCETHADMVRIYGPPCAKALRQRLAALSAADNLSVFDLDTPPEHCHPLYGNRAGHYAMRLAGKYRLIFAPNHDPVPVHQHGGIDTHQVTAICILEVSEHYD